MVGAWGYGLFQTDVELDLEWAMSVEVQEITKDPNFRFLFGDNEVAVVSLPFPLQLPPRKLMTPIQVRQLNSGLFHTLLGKFRAAKRNYWVIYLGAFSMQLGATIQERDMQVLRETMQKTKMYVKAEWQMERAMSEYRNIGTCIDG